jgi:membrane protein required for colicin V production
VGEAIPLNWADWAFISVILVSALISLKRGFIKEALSLATFIFAIAIAYIFGEKMAFLLEEHIETYSLRLTAASALLFAISLVVGAMVNYLLAELVRMTGLSGTDRFFGMFFGTARGVLVVLLLVIYMPQAFRQDQWWQDSLLVPWFLGMEDWSRQTAGNIKSATVDLVNSFEE